MILLINICKEKLHYFEFVKPIEDILKQNNIKFFTKHYKEIKKTDLNDISKIIFCGTSLYDNEFVKDINNFKLFFEINKPVLGICGGMQIIGLIFRGKLKKQTEIGFYNEEFNKEFLGLTDKQNIYHLHNYCIDFYRLKEFEIFSTNKISQAVKHKEKLIFGVLFHPEVRQKQLIINFCNLEDYLS
jgi:anthranilate/para-aminobenzoate synthase component II